MDEPFHFDSSPVSGVPAPRRGSSNDGSPAAESAKCACHDGPVVIIRLAEVTKGYGLLYIVGVKNYVLLLLWIFRVIG